MAESVTKTCMNCKVEKDIDDMRMIQVVLSPDFGGDKPHSGHAFICTDMQACRDRQVKRDLEGLACLTATR